jgi:outer membrane lipoprotein-sorting protein
MKPLNYQKKIKHYIILVLLFITLSTSLSLSISIDEVIRKTQEANNKVSTIYSILEVYYRAGNNEEYFTYKFYYQKPDKIRLEVLEGKDKGTIMVYQTGKVRYKKGGLLSFIPLSLNVDDPLVVSIRKGQIPDLTFDYIIDLLLTNNPSALKETVLLNYNCYVIEIGNSKDKLYNYSFQRIYIEKNSFLPVSLEQYEDIKGERTLVHRRVYKNLQINIKLDPQTFEI